MRLEGMNNDADNCLKLFMIWKRRYKDETNADLKKQVEDEVSKLKTDLQDGHGCEEESSPAQWPSSSCS